MPRKKKQTRKQRAASLKNLKKARAALKRKGSKRRGTKKRATRRRSRR